MNLTKFVNLTPHEIKLVRDVDGWKQSIPPSGTVARVSSTRTFVTHLNGWPLHKSKLGVPTGIPDPAPGVTYVVSSLVLATSDRDDLVAPDTSPASAIRDDAGRITGVKGFQV